MINKLSKNEFQVKLFLKHFFINFKLIISILIFSFLMSSTYACCDENSQVCDDINIRSIVCSRSRDCCSNWNMYCVELALVFACPKVCGDGVCAMNREIEEDNENCISCPRDCGECFDSTLQEKCLNASRSSFEPTNSVDPELEYQWHLGTSKVTNVWNEYNIHGENVTISIVDDGVQWQHPDIQCNYNKELSYDIDRDQITVYTWQNDNHGTSCAGLVGARDNTVCGRGAAYRTNLVSLRVLGERFSDANAAIALSWKQDDIDIYSNSWGPSDNGATIERYPYSILAIKKGAIYGRKGLGNIYVWAGGNGRGQGDVSNYDELCNSIYTICVSSTDLEGVHSSYSEPGSNLLINAPSNNVISGVARYGIVTTDRMGFPGYQSNDCHRRFGGTSAAAPLAAGIIGLILQSNPSLTWRDMQHLLVNSVDQTDSKHASWKKNSANYYFSPNYGFGRINALNGVELAKNWKSLHNTPRLFFSYNINLSEYSDDGSNSIRIPEGLDKALIFTIPVDVLMNLENIAVTVSTLNGIRGTVIIAVESPSGTVSVLASGRSRDSGTFKNFPFTSVEFWGEPSIFQQEKIGNWKIIVYDNTKDLIISTLSSLQIVLYGLPTANISSTFEAHDINQVTNILDSSFMGKNTLLKDESGEVNLYWSIDAQYEELTFAVEILNVENFGYLTLSFPIEDNKFDSIVLYFNENRTAEVSDRYSESSDVSTFVPDKALFGTDDIRLVLGMKRSKKQIFIFERSLNTQDSVHDIIFSKDSNVKLKWSIGPEQGSYDKLETPIISGESTIQIFPVPRTSSSNNRWIIIGILSGLILVILTVIIYITIFIIGGIFLYIFKRQSSKNEDHIELDEEPEGSKEGTHDSVDIENNEE